MATKTAEQLPHQRLIVRSNPENNEIIEKLLEDFQTTKKVGNDITNRNKLRLVSLANK